jgi:MraZ protein
MLRGNNTATVDEKGRLKIPTDFKEILNPKYGNEFFVTSLDGSAVRIYRMLDWEKIEEKLVPVLGEKDANNVKRQFLDRTNFWGQTASPDPQGRILIPALLRESAGIQGEVAVMGKGEYLEVGSVDRVRESMAKPLSNEDWEKLDGLGIR